MVMPARLSFNITHYIQDLYGCGCSYAVRSVTAPGLRRARRVACLQAGDGWRALHLVHVAQRFVAGRRRRQQARVRQAARLEAFASARHSHQQQASRRTHRARRSAQLRQIFTQLRDAQLLVRSPASRGRVARHRRRSQAAAATTTTTTTTAAAAAAASWRLERKRGRSRSLYEKCGRAAGQAGAVHSRAVALTGLRGAHLHACLPSCKSSSTRSPPSSFVSTTCVLLVTNSWVKIWISRLFFSFYHSNFNGKQGFYFDNLSFLQIFVYFGFFLFFIRFDFITGAKRWGKYSAFYLRLQEIELSKQTGPSAAAAAAACAASGNSNNSSGANAASSAPPEAGVKDPLPDPSDFSFVAQVRLDLLLCDLLWDDLRVFESSANYFYMKVNFEEIDKELKLFSK